MTRVSSFFSPAQDSRHVSTAANGAFNAESDRLERSEDKTENKPRASQKADWTAPCAASQSIRKGLIAGLVAAAALLAAAQSMSARAQMLESLAPVAATHAQTR